MAKQKMTTERQEELVRDFPTMTHDQLAAKFGVGRTVIMRYCKLLGLKREGKRLRGNRTESEGKICCVDREEYLRQWDSLTHEEMAKHFGVSYSSITRMNRILGLVKKRPENRPVAKRYPPEKRIQDSREVYQSLWKTMGNRALAEHYGVCESTIGSTNRRFGLSRREFDEEAFREAWKLNSTKAVAEKLGLSRRRVQFLAKSIGLKIEKPPKIEKPKRIRGPRKVYVKKNPLWGEIGRLKKQQSEKRKAEREEKRQARIEAEAQNKLRKQQAKEQRAIELEASRLKAAEAYQKMRVEQKEAKRREADRAKAEREKLLAAQREEKRKEHERNASAAKRQWEYNGRKNAKRAEAKRLPMKAVDDSVPKVFIKKIRAWVYLKPNQSPEEILRKYGAVA